MIQRALADLRVMKSDRVQPFAHRGGEATEERFQVIGVPRNNELGVLVTHFARVPRASEKTHIGRDANCYRTWSSAAECPDSSAAWCRTPEPLVRCNGSSGNRTLRFPIAYALL